MIVAIPTLSESTMRVISGILAAALLLATGATAHHSFAPYDIRTRIELTGVVESWRFIRPHPQLVLRETGDDGRTWTLEVATRQWERQEIPRDAIRNGDQLDVMIWPRRDGSPEGVLSAFTSDGVFTLIHDQVRQRSANEAADAAERGN